ncbi:hypothetical protein BMS3Abin07_02596 [bacterium BMS3Abin07]|nr:hypothetical protein BMS3Abin07_02596 [bacterium BMS3Abin07]GBE32341.1 hypothetical protein BMS3Bbin05_01254 [bacterium BMS3Bbin05]HDO21704.1 zf-HC2 domain-containing protein [Nitrospirota bacterium]HDZ87659.1 zf-HC2 domain-containing protein [Nitrospirota bacterium]
MKPGHDEIKEMLADYINDQTSRKMNELIKSHIVECKECMEELESLMDLKNLAIPDPGELFWKTLPQRVRARTEEESRRSFSLRTFLLRPVTATALAAVLAISLFIYFQGGNTLLPDPSFTDPFNKAMPDYSQIPDKAVPSIQITENEIDTNGEFTDNYSYNYDLFSMSSDELAVIYKKLKKTI